MTVEQMLLESDWWEQLQNHQGVRINFGKLVMGDGNVYNGMNGERRIGGDVIG